MGGNAGKYHDKLSESLGTGEVEAVLHSKLQISNLFAILFKKLHPLYSIECACILIYNEQLTVVKEFFKSNCDLETERLVTEIHTQPTELTSQQKMIADYSFPVLKTDKEWLEETGINHQPLNNNASYQYHCYIPLEVENKVLGTFELHNSIAFNPEILAFCCSIADLLADIIQHQHRRSTNKVKDSQAASSLLPDMLHINSLEDVFDIVAKLFPLANINIGKQVDELKALAEQVNDDGLYKPDAIIVQPGNPNMIGSSSGMQRIFGLIGQVANSDSTVLIMSETGTGKELIARAIHEHSDRRNHPMISINCAAIPINLIESQLFGHEKGSFTGAIDKHIGKFELADNSTLFLDEIGELPLDLQVKLLRALQEKEIERVGGTSVIRCNVRVIAATNRNLLNEVEHGRFRRDLYFRLNVIPIQLPALRERVDDIPLLAVHFLKKYAGKSGKQITGFTKAAIRQLCNYPWPGNVREMEHLIERHVLLSKKPVINSIELPVVETMMPGHSGKLKKIKTIDENERDHIFEVLQLCNGRVSGPYGAAKLLGVPPTTLNSKIKKLGLNKKHF